MEKEVMIALLSLIGTLVGSYFANNKSMAVMDEKISGVKEDIKILSDRVDKHNNLVSRMSVVEEHLRIIDK